ncbi:MerR family transcriptional regulator [Bacillus weihaiensis]|uniref:HTH merR-type domain-containing protein n=1 Tax=Bacillus weihaiensis TaxID=1547283 RepID=A0A1L3MPZ0_9BACI|nr:MerR family transcriptional regulator [Bacillus weihaiensis]APH04421.1 hypothetical protein A9C19_06475 [Bacillus weihaiensis]
MAAKYVTISKAAALIGEKSFILKNWEEEFSEFITVNRDEKNSRLLTTDNIEFFRKIKSFKESNLDNETIKQLLRNQVAGMKAQDSNMQTSELEELKSSLSRITSFIDSREVQEILKLNEKLNQLEKNVVHSVHQKISDTAKLQTEVARFEFSDVQDMISSLAEKAENERALYKEEVHKEREIAQKQTDAREERFLAFVKDHQQRQEKLKQEQKFGLNFLKQKIGFAK